MRLFFIFFISSLAFAQTFTLSGLQYKQEGGRWYRFDNNIPGDPVVPERILVKTNLFNPLSSAELQNFGLQHITIENGPFWGKWYVLSVGIGNDPFAYAQILEQSSLFSHIGFDGIGEFADSPNDPLYPQQWNLDDSKLRMELAWSITRGEPSTVIGVVDSGVEWSHEDLQKNIWINPREIPGNGIDDDHNGFVDDLTGWNFVQNNNFPWDSLGHGTSVAGIMAAQTNNSKGIAGIAGGDNVFNGIRLMILRIGGPEPLFASGAAQAIEYAVNNGAKVVNASFAFISDYPVLQESINYAVDEKNLAIIAAMGNEGDIIRPKYPAKYPNTIAVGATEIQDRRWKSEQVNCGSEKGSHLDLMAPGGGIQDGLCNDGNIWSTSIPNQYTLFGGTSAAAPHCAALASLIFSLDSTYSYREVQRIMEHTAKDLGPAGWDNQYGHGRIDAYLALRSVQLRPQNLSVAVPVAHPVLSWSLPPNHPPLIHIKIWRAILNHEQEPPQYELIATTTQPPFVDNTVRINQPQDMLVRYRVSAVYQGENYNQGNGNLETGKSNAVDVFASQLIFEKIAVLPWQNYGLEGLDINKLIVHNTQLYAAAGSAGLWRRDFTLPTSQWEYIGFSDTAAIPGPVIDLIIQESQHFQLPRIFITLASGDSTTPAVVRSIDGGISWQAADAGIPAQEKGYGGYLTASVLSPDTLFFSPFIHLYRSTNGGISWDSISYANKPILIPGPSGSSEIVWASRWSPFNFWFSIYSEDYGETWIEQYPPPNGWWFIDVLERAPGSDTLYAGGGRFWKSVDNGHNWTISINRSLQYANILISPINHNHIITGGSKSISSPINYYESFDGGLTWNTEQNFPDTTGITALVWVPDQGYIFAGAKKHWSSPPLGIGGVYFRQVDPMATGHYSSSLLKTFELYQNYPNPFNSITAIEYEISRKSLVTLEIYNMLSQKIKTLVNKVEPPGHKVVFWDGKDKMGKPASSGIYIYKLSLNGTDHKSKKMILIK